GRPSVLASDRPPCAAGVYEFPLDLPGVALHDTLHALPRDAVGTLCGNPEVPSPCETRASSHLSRSGKEKRTLRGIGWSPPCPPPRAFSISALARHSRAGIVYRNRHSGSRRKRKELLLHVSLRPADPVFRGASSRQANRRNRA